MAMQVSELAGWLLASGAGAALGVFFFGGLRWTLERSLRSARPVAWQLGSVLVRTGVTLAGIWLAGGGRWDRMLLALAAFTAVRIWMVRAAPLATREAGHAPEP